jgi:hypothetical protein
MVESRATAIENLTVPRYDFFAMLKMALAGLCGWG